MGTILQLTSSTNTPIVPLVPSGLLRSSQELGMGKIHQVTTAICWRSLSQSCWTAILWQFINFPKQIFHSKRILRSPASKEAYFIMNVMSRTSWTASYLEEILPKRAYLTSEQRNSERATVWRENKTFFKNIHP